MNASVTNSTGWTYDTSQPANEERPYKAFIIWGVVFLIVVLFGYELTKQITVYAFLQLPIGSYIYTSEKFMDAVVRLTVLPTIFIPFFAAIMCLKIAKEAKNEGSKPVAKRGLFVRVGFFALAIILLVVRWPYWQRVIESLPDPSINSSQLWMATGWFSEIVGLIIMLIVGVFLGKFSCHLTKTHQEVAL